MRVDEVWYPWKELSTSVTSLSFFLCPSLFAHDTKKRENIDNMIMKSFVLWYFKVLENSNSRMLGPPYLSVPTWYTVSLGLIPIRSKLFHWIQIWTLALATLITDWAHNWRNHFQILRFILESAGMLIPTKKRTNILRWYDKLLILFFFVFTFCFISSNENDFRFRDR